MPRHSIVKPTLVYIAGVGLALALTVAIASQFAPPARAETSAAPTELKLAAGQKLVDVSWRCFGDYPCRPFVLTRAMRKDETAETYALSSPYSDAADAYVIKESR